MRAIEHAPASGAGTVTAEAIVVAGTLTLEIVVHAAALRAMPWYRGGQTVAVMLGTRHEAGMLRIVRCGPYRLLARGSGRLEKLPPVQLRVTRLEWMDGEVHPAETVMHEIGPTQMELVLPSWARPPVPAVAPRTDYSPVRTHSLGEFLDPPLAGSAR